LYGPWGGKAASVRTDLGFDDIRNDPAYDYRSQDSWMDTLSIEKVETAARALLTKIRETAG
jgi:hypothetical protein